MPGRNPPWGWDRAGEKAPTCAVARSLRGVGRGRAGARGQLGAGLGVRDVHRARGCGLPAAGSREGDPRLLPLLLQAEDTRDPTAVAAATGTAEAVVVAEAEAEEEEVSARSSRFLLPGRASAGEARGGQE